MQNGQVSRYTLSEDRRSQRQLLTLQEASAHLLPQPYLTAAI